MLRSSSVAPYSLARSDASPAPAPTPKAVAAAKPPTGPNAAAGKKEAMEPMPDASLYVMESLSPPSGVKRSAIDFIFWRDFTSASSSCRAAAPRAAVSYIPTAPEARPVATFSKNPASSSSLGVEYSRAYSRLYI